MPKPPAAPDRDWTQHDVEHVRTLLRHDARAPLHILALYGQVLADRAETAELGGPIVDAARDVRAVFDQIERWLSLGPPTRGPADPSAIVHELAKGRKLSIDSDADGQVAMHPRHLRLVLEALLGPTGGPSVDVGIQDDGAAIAITVSIPSGGDLAPDSLAMVTRLIAASGGTFDVHPSSWRVALPRV